MAELTIAIRAQNQAQAALNQLKGGLQNIQRQAQSASQQMQAMGQSLAGIGSKLTVGVTAPILGFAGAAIKAAGDAEQLEVAFTTMLGSADKAKTMMAELSKFAAATPFESTEIQGASKMLLAFGVAAEDIIPTMTNLGDIAAGLNIPLGDMAYLFGTTRASGRLMTADLNQFTSRGIPMIAALAKTMNVAEKDVKGLVEAGKVGFPEVQAALSSLTAEGGQFSGLMAAQSQTLFGLFSTFKDTIGLTMTEIGAQIIETFDLKSKLAGALVWLEKAKNAILNFAKTQPQLFKLGIAFATVAAAIGPVMIGLGMLLTAIAPLAPAFALLISPMALVVASLGALFAFDFLGVRTAFEGVVDVLANYSDAVLDAGFGTIESQESINLFPAIIQPAARGIDKFIGALLNYRDAVIDAGFGTIESQESIGLFPSSLRSAASAADSIIGALKNYRDAVVDAGLGTAESQESIDLFPPAIQSVARALDTAARAISDFVTKGDIEGIKAIGESIKTALGNIEPPSFSDVWNAAKLTITTVVSEVDWDVPKEQFDKLKTATLEAIAGIEWSTMAAGVGKGARNAFDGIKTWVTGQISAVDWSTIGGVGKGAVNLFGQLTTAVRTQLSTIDWKTLTDNANVLWGTLIIAVKSGLGSLDWSALITNASTYFATLVSGVKTAIGGIDWSTLGGVGKGAVNIFDKLKTAVMDQIAGIQWSTITGDALTKLQTGATTLKDTIIGTITGFEWTLDATQITDLQSVLAEAQPYIDQIFGADGIIQTITSTINESITAIGDRLASEDGKKIGEQFSGILTGFATLAGLFATMQLEAAGERASALISLGTDVITFLSDFGKGIDTAALTEAITSFAGNFAEQLKTVLGDKEMLDLGGAIGAFASTIITELGQALSGGTGKETGEAAAGAVGAISTAAENIIVGIANELAKTDWKLFGDQLTQFVEGFVGALLTAIVESDYQAAGDRVMNAIWDAVVAAVSGGFSKNAEPFGDPFKKFAPRTMIGPAENPDQPLVVWSDFIDKLDWKTVVDQLLWPSYIIGKLDWVQWIEGKLLWTVFIPNKLDWGDFVPDFDWTGILPWLQGLSQANSQAGRTNHKNALGTSNWRGGLTWVGETGPELVALPRTSRIFSNQESQEVAFASATASAPQIVIQQMNVRSEADIYSVSYELGNLQRQRKSRRR